MNENEVLETTEDIETELTEIVRSVERIRELIDKLGNHYLDKQLTLKFLKGEENV